MPKIPIGQKPYFNIDPASKTAVLADTCIDGFIDEAETVAVRMGATSFADTGTGQPGTGLFYWDKADVLVAVTGGHVVKIDKNAGMTEITGTVFSQTTPTTFQDCSTLNDTPWLYMCDGGYPVYTTGTTATRLTAASGAPSAATHAGWVGGRVMFNLAGTRKFYANDVDPDTGELSLTYFLESENPMTAEKQPDDVKAIISEWDEAYVWGSQGCEVWRADNVFFSPVDGAYMPVGLAAAYSVAKVDNTLFGLCLVDGLKKLAVVKLAGRSPQVVSLPIEKLLNTYTTVSDAIGFTTARSEYILTFPTEGVTWCYDYLRDKWYQWSRWNPLYATREQYFGQFTARAWNKIFIQSRLDGKIYYLDDTVSKDGDDGIITEYFTGNIDHGTYRRKQTDFVRAMLKRGDGNDYSAEPVMMVKWRDNGAAEWKTERQISLGKPGVREFHKTLFYLGQYRSRQYSFSFSDSVDYRLVGVEEEVEVLAG